MEWLGIHVPDELKEELKTSDNILEKSVNICLDIANQLTAYCTERNIPFGFNIESVAIRKEEIDASLGLLNTVRELLQVNGLRDEVVKRSKQVV